MNREATIKRNEQIRSEYKSGITIETLSIKYHLQYKNLRQILREEIRALSDTFRTYAEPLKLWRVRISPHEDAIMKGYESRELVILGQSAEEIRSKISITLDDYDWYVEEPVRVSMMELLQQ